MLVTDVGDQSTDFGDHRELGTNIKYQSPTSHSGVLSKNIVRGLKFGPPMGCTWTKTDRVGHIICHIYKRKTLYYFRRIEHRVLRDVLEICILSNHVTKAQDSTRP